MSKGEGYLPAKIVTQCGWDAVRKGEVVVVYVLKCRGKGGSSTERLYYFVRIISRMHNAFNFTCT